MHDMASHAAHPSLPPPSGEQSAALQHRQWNSARLLSRGLAAIERFLASSRTERSPWLAVAFGTGIVTWFALPTWWHWAAALSTMLALCAVIALLISRRSEVPYIRQTLLFGVLVIAAGGLTVWVRSELVGAQPIDRPLVGTFAGQVIAIEYQPALARSRLVLATREPVSGRAIRVRINVDLVEADALPEPGSVVRIRARLMPPAPPMLPGSYDFARTAWFSGLAATGSALDPPEIISGPTSHRSLANLRAWLSATALDRLPDSRGGVAAALLTGDRGGISEVDAQAMRDAGLAHLLSISGLHVSAVIAAAYLIALRVFALWPWLALRTRLPVVAAAAGAGVGIGYTLLTGSEVPTVRSCIAALLVLAAVALGREALSLRMLAVAALAVMALWPEAVMGPSFQMSFAAVLAIIALSNSEPVKRWFAPREEGWTARGLRHLAMLLLTGIVIELALMPIGFYHFHRAGVYGALANVVAIPLTTIVVMPALALAVAFDTIGAGAPFWWLAGAALDLLLAIAHWVSSRPGSVTVLPVMGGGSFLLFVGGGLWLALTSGHTRLVGLVPAVIGVVSLMMLRPPDILVSGDGHHVGVVEEGENRLLVLRDGKSSYASDNLREIAGMVGATSALAEWPGAQCSEDFCALVIERGKEPYRKRWNVLIARSRQIAPERALAAACALSDIVIADRRLPSSCKPRWLKADRRLLDQTGGITINLTAATIDTVAEGQGQHGWWRTVQPFQPRPPVSTATSTPPS